MNILISQKVKISFLFLVVSSLAACGGGNDTVVNKTPATGTYNGLATQATFSRSNLKKFDPGSISVTRIKASGINSKRPATQILSKTMSNINAYDASFTIPLNYKKRTENCTISGTVVIEESTNPNTTGDYSVSRTYDNCSFVTGTIENGKESFSFLEDLTNPENNTFSASFENYSYQNSIEHTVTNGNLTGSGSTSLTITMNMVIEDKIINETVKFEDIILTIETSANQEALTISGKIYQSSIGYFTVETPAPVVTINGDMYPSSGQMVFTGKSEVPNLKATIEITYLDVNSYKVKIDFDSAGNANDIAEIDQTCTWAQPCDIAFGF